MIKHAFKIIIVVIMVALFSTANLPDASAARLDNWSTTSAGGNLAPVMFSTPDWDSYVHFAVYDFGAGDPIDGETGFQGFPFAFSPSGTMSVNPGEYLYVYQVDHDPGALAALNGAFLQIDMGSESAVTSVGFTNDTDIDIFGLGSGDADELPDYAWANFPGGGIIWDHTTNHVEAGDESFTLFITSTAAPIYTLGTLANAGYQDQQFLPSPMVPEPVSSVLFIAGGVTLGFRRFRKRRNS